MESDELVKRLKKSRYYKEYAEADEIERNIDTITEAHPELKGLVDDTIHGANESVKKLTKLIEKDESIKSYVKVLTEVAIRRAKCRGNMAIEQIYSSFLRKI